MHLNKHGWGLKEMLLLSGILLIFLIIAVYYIVSLYNGLDNFKTNYNDIERKLEDQALIYINDYYDEILNSDGITITRNVLRSYNLDVILEDNNGNSCSGYAKASKTHGKVFVKGYIKCKNYMTKGYEEVKVNEKK